MLSYTAHNVCKNLIHPFSYSCKRNCFDRIEEEERYVIFDKFLSFDCKNEQDAYLQSMISVAEVKQRRRRKPETDSSKPSRGSTYNYHITTCSGMYQVCKKAFLNIHGIKADRVRRLCSLLSQGLSPKDMRGKNVSGNAKPPSVRATIMEHIQSFPQKISHYAQKEIRYLDAKLTVKIMHNMFHAKYPEFGANYSFYKKVFNDQFSLKFGRPQVDTCCTCEEFAVKIKSKFLNDSAKRVAAAEKVVHLRRANKFYEKIKEVTELVRSDTSGKIGAVCIDYMQNLDLPRIPVQETFYLRQLTVNVFCIHNLKDNQATFLVYHEGVGGKGPNEVCTFLYEYLKKNMNGVESLHIFSDGCGGQNRNHTMIRMLSSLTSTKMFKDIKQYFPVRGHSFLPCDRDFAVLKRKLRRCDRIYTVKEVADILLSASTSNKFKVILPSTKDIVDFKQWWPKHYKKNMLSIDSIGKNVPLDQKILFKISQYTFFHYSAEQDGLVTTKEYIGGFISYTFSIKNASGAALQLPTKSAYTGKRPINKKKMEDLKKLENYLPQEREVKLFYEHIFKWPVCDRENTEE